jgi:DNA-binding beta-propeller fold protein YncE
MASIVLLFSYCPLVTSNRKAVLLCSSMSGVVYVATSGDKLYYTDTNTNTVTCCDLHGTTQWEFKDKRVLQGPLGISVDNDGNVYVVGYYSNNVVVMRIHGNSCHDFLTFYIYYIYAWVTSKSR